MNWWQSVQFDLQESWLSVKRKKHYSLIISIILSIGIFSIILSSSILKGIEQKFDQDIIKLGANNIRLEAQYDSALKTAIESIPFDFKASHAIVHSQQVEFQKQSYDFMTSDRFWLELEGFELLSGRNFTTLDKTNNNKVCLVAERLAKQLSGSHIKTPHSYCQIIGVFNPSKDASASNLYTLNYHNLAVQLQLLPNHNAQVFSTLKFHDNVNVNELEKAANQIHSSLELFNKQANLYTATALIKKKQEQTLIFYIFNWLIAILTLISAAGSLVAMLVSSFNENIKELALRSCMGANKFRLANLFIGKSMIIASFASITGIALGLIAVIILPRFIDIDIDLNFLAVFIAPLCTLTLAALASIVPVQMIRKLDPAIALRQLML